MKIMFACHGNICRSPMAEYILKSMLDNNKYIISSSALSNEEYNNDMYPPVKKILDKNNIKYSTHKAHKMTQEEYDNYDLIVVMEKYQIEKVYNIYGKSNKVITLLDEDIEDPWYTNNFDKVYNQIYYGCEKLMKELQ